MKKKLLAGLATGLSLMIVPCFEAAAVPIFNSANGHYYDMIDSTINWGDANTAASSQTYLGVAGHLVTITDAPENLFITSSFGGTAINLHWTGGVQPDGSTEPGGGWSWVTGEAFVFTNWWGSEPNNNPNGENRIIFDHGVNANGKGWNDYTGGLNARGYVVEFDTAPVPEPATMVLFCTGIAGLAGIRIRRKKK
jgi:hypothetical protein